MSYSKLILRDSAEIVWPLDDLNQSSSYSYPINFYSSTASSYAANINFNNCSIQGIPIIYGGNTALTLTSPSICFSIPAIGRFSDLYRDKHSTLSFWIKIDSLSLQEKPILKRRGYEYCGLFIKENYLIFKFGKEEDHSVIIGELTNPNEPHLIVLGISPGYRYMMIDSISSSTKVYSDSFPDFNGDFTNDFIDFYGPENKSWTIDCPTFFPNILEDSIVKRHYVYGLGKWASYDIFYPRGGSLYNFTTIATERNYSISWDFPEEWRFVEFEDLFFNYESIESIKFNLPVLFSYDNNITKNNNEIIFNSASQTSVSYIDINKIQSKIYENNSLFIKYKIPSTALIEGVPQRLATFGEIPDKDMLCIDLESNSGSTQVKFSISETGEYVYLNFDNPSPGKEFYTGFQFVSQSKFYLLEDGGNLQTASFNYYNNEGYGQDPLREYYPFNDLVSLRIGATTTYDLQNTNLSAPYEFNQFRGTFCKVLTVKNNDIDFINNIQYLDEYKKSRYSVEYFTNEKRFKLSTYGTGEFYIHSIDIGDFISDYNQKLDANFVEIGYPDIPSSSAINFYVTQLNYSGSVVYPKTKLTHKNYLNFINNQNISGTYLKFDFEIYSEDKLYYPPKIQYFKMETFGAGEGKLLLRDKDGPPVYIYPNSSSTIYLPEMTWTPNIFIKNDSGLKSYNNIIEFSPNIISKPLEPREIDGLILWLDARFPSGFRKTLPNDDSRLLEWTDLSGNNFHATASIQTAPIYRSQSLNLLTLNQLTGSELNTTNNIDAFNSNVESSIQSITGTKSIAIIPNNLSNNSYIEFNNTASLSTFINQKYTVVGSIKLNKKQTASALNEHARKIVVFNNDGAGEQLVSESASIINSAGIYTASLMFSTSASTVSSRIKFYNGSYLPDDIVYWDNLGLYPISSSVIYGSGGTASVKNIITTWIPPLSSYDSPTVKFDGKSTFMKSSASAINQYMVYIVSRSFIDSGIISSSSFSLSINDQTINISGGDSLVESNNAFNIYSIIVDSSSARLVLNGIPYYKNITGFIDSLTIGKYLNKYLSGDISAVLIYAGNHNYQTRSAIENWLYESFNLSQKVIGYTKINDVYSSTYGSRYAISEIN